MAVLGLSDRQALSDFFADPAGLQWQQRVRLRALLLPPPPPTPTHPDYTAERLGLHAHRITALGRAAP